MTSCEPYNVTSGWWRCVSQVVGQWYIVHVPHYIYHAYTVYSIQMYNMKSFNNRKWLPIIGGSCHKYNFCCDTYLLRQTHVCHDKMFCLDNHTFVMTKGVLLWPVSVVTKVLFFLRQNVCHDKNYTCGSSRQWKLPCWEVFSWSTAPRTQ